MDTLARMTPAARRIATEVAEITGVDAADLDHTFTGCDDDGFGRFGFQHVDGASYTATTRGGVQAVEAVDESRRIVLARGDDGEWRAAACEEKPRAEAPRRTLGDLAAVELVDSAYEEMRGLSERLKAIGVDDLLVTAYMGSAWCRISVARDTLRQEQEAGA